MSNLNAKQRILDKLDAYAERMNDDGRYWCQVNRNRAYEIRAVVETLSDAQANKIERAVAEIENRPKNPNPLLDFGPVVVSPTDYLQFLE